MRWKFVLKEDHLGYKELVKTLDLSKKVQAYWHLTEACNLHCDHCYNQKESKKSLSLEKLSEILSIIKNEGVRIVSFTGGEPLLSPYFFEVARQTNNLDIFTTLCTNGSLMDNQTIENLLDSGVRRIQISVDGCKETHDMIRKKQGTFDHVCDIIRKCVDSNMYVIANSVITTQNIDELPELYNHLAGLGIHEYRTMKQIPLGHSSKIQVLPSREDYIKVLRRLCKLHSGWINAEDSFNFTQSVVGENKELKKAVKFSGCKGGKYSFFVLANGDVSPCLCTDVVCGNILTEQSEKIFNSENYKSFVDGHINACSPCPEVDACGGGCRCISYGYSGNFDSKDPFCNI